MGKKRKSTHRQQEIIDPFDWARDYLTQSEIKQLEKSLALEIPASIRINCLKSDPIKFIAALEARYGWQADPIPFTTSGFWVRSANSAPSSTIEHRMGYYYIQEAASMLPVELFDLNSSANSLILDMAASPGGKTIHLIDKTRDQALVIANDASRSRIPALQVVLRNWGAINQAVTCQQGEWFGYAMPETFDAVLLDTPCSMQGLRVSASHKVRPITKNEILALAERQINLLSSALQTVKVGGTVVYSTCTLSPHENEGVLNTILERYPGTFQIMDITDRLSKPAPGVGNIHGNPLPDAVTRAARLWPHIFNTAGFFSAKLIKTRPLSQPKQNHPEIFDNHINLLGDADAVSIIGQIESQFGIDLQGIMVKQSLTITEDKGNFMLMPKQLLGIHKQLPIHSFGIALGKPLPDCWQPSHVLVSRFGDQFSQNVYTLDDKYLERWNRGEDIRGVSSSTIASGTVVAVRDQSGRNLGRGKILSDRIKNQLPTRLF